MLYGKLQRTHQLIPPLIHTTVYKLLHSYALIYTNTIDSGLN